jgi:glycosyltransferase involved in cell wall biosynthesis
MASVSQKPDEATIVKVCFFAKVKDPAYLSWISFYAVDVQLLRDLGHEVVVATRPLDVPLDADFYFVWWPGWGLFPIAVARLLRRPHILIGNVHLQDAEFGYRASPWHKRLAIRCSLRAADAVLAVSAAELDGVKRLGARHADLVYHGVDMCGQQATYADRNNLVFSIGNMSSEGSIRRKRFDNVVRAVPLVLKRVPDARFVFAGLRGDCRMLDELASSLGVAEHVDLPGRIDADLRTKYLLSARVLAQPSVWEGFGLAQLEAMAHGLPVVTSNVGAIPEILGDAGQYCDSDSPESIADNIVGLLTDALAWGRMSERGKRRAAEFSIARRREAIAAVMAREITRRSRKNSLK